MTLTQRLTHNAATDWLEERFRVKEALRAALSAPRARPAAAWLGCLGGLALGLLGLQVATGVYLSACYQPAPGLAWRSIAAIDTGLACGWLVRRLHAASGNLMLLLAAAHLLRVLVAGAYKKPRELHWLSGAALLLLTLALAATGRLLAGAGAAGSGGWLSLGQLFALHLGLPFALLPLAALHLLLARRTGPHEALAEPLHGGRPGPEADGAELGLCEALTRWLLAGLGLAALLLAVAVYAPGLVVETAPAADRPEPWYLLALWQLFRLAPSPLLGGGVLGLAAAAFCLLPFWERGRPRPFWQRPVFPKATLIVVTLLVALSVWGRLGA
jgi:quinol-cytochrome oxidoreductase complex cytochrome b subunit